MVPPPIARPLTAWPGQIGVGLQLTVRKMPRLGSFTGGSQSQRFRRWIHSCCSATLPGTLLLGAAKRLFLNRVSVGRFRRWG